MKLVGEGTLYVNAPELFQSIPYLVRLHSNREVLRRKTLILRSSFFTAVGIASVASYKTCFSQFEFSRQKYVCVFLLICILIFTLKMIFIEN